MTDEVVDDASLLIGIWSQGGLPQAVSPPLHEHENATVAK